MTIKENIMVRWELLKAVHRRALISDTFSTECWIAWLIILVGLSVILIPNLFSPSFWLMEIILKIPRWLWGSLLIYTGYKSLIALTEENTTRARHDATRFGLRVGVFFTGMTLFSAFAGNIGLGLVVFPFYAFQQLMMLWRFAGKFNT